MFLTFAPENSSLHPLPHLKFINSKIAKNDFLVYLPPVKFCHRAKIFSRDIFENECYTICLKMNRCNFNTHFTEMDFFFRKCRLISLLVKAK